MMSKKIITILSIFFIGYSCQCQSLEDDKKIINKDNLLSKKDIQELIEITAQSAIAKQEKDSLINLIFDRTNHPLDFDRIHKSFNFHQAPNLKNPTPTIDEWNAYNGDKKMWEIANLSYFLYEFRLIGNVDGFSNVIFSLQNSKHGNSINFESINFDSINIENKDFNTSMQEFDKELRKSGRMMSIIDLGVFVIKTNDFEKFNEIIRKTIWKEITTYNSR